MADDNVAISPVPAPVVAGVPTYIKTFNTKDQNGVIVEMQAVVITNEYGRAVDLMTEATGRDIVRLLQMLVAQTVNYDTTSTDL